MELGLNQEQEILRDTARNFMKRESPVESLRRLRDQNLPYDQEIWKRLAEMGWLGVTIPEEYGGASGSFLDLCILMEAMGEVCYSGPFFSTVVMGALAVLHYGSDGQKEKILPGVASGELIMASAICEPGSWHHPKSLQTVAEPHPGGYRLSGTKLFVENAHLAETILCLARTDQGPTVFLVNGRDPAVKSTPMRTLAYEGHCEVVLDDVRVAPEDVLGEPGQGDEIIEKITHWATAAKCMEMVGCMQTTFDMTLQHARERVQFGRPIGSFQAVQHHCANMAVELDGARFLSYRAAWLLSQGIDAAKEVSMAKAWTGRAARRVTSLAHQIHGAVAFCDEHNLHFFYRRAKAAETLFGDTPYHLERIAQMLGL